VGVVPQAGVVCVSLVIVFIEWDRFTKACGVELSTKPFPSVGVYVMLICCIGSGRSKGIFKFSLTLSFIIVAELCDIALSVVEFVIKNKPFN
jgi:hypothetical protein